MPRPSALCTGGAVPASVVNGDSERAGVVLQVIVVHAEIQAAGRTDADRASFVADEEAIARVADTPDERCGGPVRDRAGGIVRGVPLPFRTILTARTPSYTARRLEENCLARTKIDPGVLPLNP